MTVLPVRLAFTHTRAGTIPVSVSSGLSLAPEHVLIVQHRHDHKVAGRLAASALFAREMISIEDDVVDVLLVDAGGEVRLGDIVTDERTDDPERAWGALGLPLGCETRLSPVPPGDDDVGAALASTGHRLTMESNTHDVMPGDQISIDGSTWQVVAIDRRNDRMTMRQAKGKEREVAFRQTILEAG